MSKKRVLFASLIIPLMIVLIAWYLVGFYPFGDKTIMAIDFGNQYIDLFAFMRRTLMTGNFSNFFYSFSKSIGGSTVGIWAYYLMSPLNLIYLLFPAQHIAAAATLIVWLRYGLMGLSFAYYILKRQASDNNHYMIIPIFATIYALCGFTISYQMNPLFMDALIMLPLILIALEELLDGGKPYKYMIILALMVIFQFYMAFMICIFIVLYSIYYLISHHWNQSTFSENINYFMRKSGLLAGASILAVAMISFFVFPVLFNLLDSKGELQTGMKFLWELQINPFDILSKFFMGAFDNQSWSAGPNLPNLYVGSLGLIGLVGYYASKSISLREKIASLLVFLVFFVSMVHKFTNQLWHMGQSPAGFFYRFSFLISFFIILLAYRYFVRTQALKPFYFFILSGLVLLGVSIIITQDHSFLENIQIQASVFLFGLIALILTRNFKLKWFLIGLIVFVELGANMVIIQSRLNYTNEGTFRNAIEITDKAIDQIRPNHDDFYRIDNLFYRSKNDPFMHQFPGLTNFSSNLENATRNLFYYFGNNGINAATTYNGSPLTDGLFGIKYTLEDKKIPADQLDSDIDYIFRNDFNRMDVLSGYNRVGETERFDIYQNPNYLPIAYAVNQETIEFQPQLDQPILNYQNLLNLLNPNQQHIVEEIHDIELTTENLTIHNNDDNTRFIQKDEQMTEGSITFSFTPTSDDSYFVQIPTSLKRTDDNKNSFDINGDKLAFITNFSHAQLVNVASHAQEEVQNITIKTESDQTIDISDFRIIRFDDQKVSQLLDQMGQQGMKVKVWGSNFFKGEINVSGPENWVMTSIPYDRGWQVKIDGQAVETKTAWQSLLAFPINSGNHHLEMTYIPPGLYIGLGISLISCVLFVGILLIQQRKSDKIL